MFLKKLEVKYTINRVRYFIDTGLKIVRCNAAIEDGQRIDISTARSTNILIDDIISFLYDPPRFSRFKISEL